MISDPASEEFGEPVPRSILHIAYQQIKKGAVGLAEMNEGWVAMERISATDLVTWQGKKRCGPGRDPRILGVERDQSNNRWSTFRDGFVRMVMPIMISTGNGLLATSPVKAGDWPFWGPLAIMELLQAVQSSGHGMIGYHEKWVST